MVVSQNFDFVVVKFTVMLIFLDSVVVGIDFQKPLPFQLLPSPSSFDSSWHYNFAMPQSHFD